MKLDRQQMHLFGVITLESVLKGNACSLTLWDIARPLCLHYNHYVSHSVHPSISPSVRGRLVKILITLEPHVMFCSNFAYKYEGHLESS